MITQIIASNNSLTIISEFAFRVEGEYTNLQ